MNRDSSLWSGIFRPILFSLCLVACLAPQGAFSNGLLAEPTTINGLVFDEVAAVPPHTGYFRMDVARSGEFTGKLLLGKQRTAFSGRFNDTGTARVHVWVPTRDYELSSDDYGLDFREVKKLKWILALQLTNGLYDVVGQILPHQRTGWSGVLQGLRAGHGARLNPAPQAGRYTVVLPVGLDGQTGPAGDAWGALTVDENGYVLLQGGLPDNSRYTVTSILSADGTWPLFVSFDCGRGMLVGWLQFTNSSESKLIGPLNWVRLRDPDTDFYQAGFTNQTSVVASSYDRPAPDQPMLKLTNAVLTLNRGDITSSITDSLIVSTAATLKGSGDSPCSITFIPGSGLFMGWAESRGTGQFFQLSGTVIQSRNSAFGCFMGNAINGEVIIEDDPAVGRPGP